MVLQTNSSPQTPGSSGETTTSAGPLEAGAAINHLNQPIENPSNNKPTSFARYLVISHADKDKDITRVNPYAMQKALEILIGQDFECTRNERAKLVEIHVRARRASETLLNLEKLDCTEFIVPVRVFKHKTKNTCKGVIHCNSIGDTPKSQLLRQMADYNVTEIFQLSKTKNGKTEPLDSYIITFDSETPPREMNMGFGTKAKVLTYYPNPRLCRSCQRYGHGANNCRNTQICAKCGTEGHAYDGCDKDQKCYHCKSPDHAASSKECPMFVLEKRVLKMMTDERIPPLEARKVVYRDSQDLVSKVPSLSSYIKATWNNVIAGPNSIPAVRSGQSQPPLPLPPVQQSVDLSTVLDHPVFTSLVSAQERLSTQQDTLTKQQETIFEQQSAMLAQQKKNEENMETMLSVMNGMMGFMQTMLEMVVKTCPQNAQQCIPQFQQLQNDFTIQQQQMLLDANNSSSMEVQQLSSKRSHSDSSEVDAEDVLRTKKPAFTKNPVNNSSSQNAVGRQDNPATSSVSAAEVQVEQPKACSAAASVSGAEAQGELSGSGSASAALPLPKSPVGAATKGGIGKKSSSTTISKDGTKPAVPKKTLDRGRTPGSKEEKVAPGQGRARVDINKIKF